jgi:nucleotide-binding universal stress UspA family protein
MAFHVITTRLNGSPSDVSVLNGALSLTKVSNGHVRALFCRPDPRIVASGIYDGVYTAYYEDLVITMERQWAALANKALARYEAWRAKNSVRSAQDPESGNGPSAEWCDIKGNEMETIRRQGRISDVIVAPMPSRHLQDPYDATFETALLDTGRPILLIPGNKPVLVEGGKMLIAWDGSAEASRAVAAAMPMLCRAEQVLVFTAAMDGRTDREMANELVSYLKWHQAPASVLYQEDEESASVEESLLAAAHKARADLLVMGAYTHNRWRELIFGGVTRHMLGHADMPVLMAH